MNTNLNSGQKVDSTKGIPSFGGQNQGQVHENSGSRARSGAANDPLAHYHRHVNTPDHPNLQGPNFQSHSRSSHSQTPLLSHEPFPKNSTDLSASSLPILPTQNLATDLSKPFQHLPLPHSPEDSDSALWPQSIQHQQATHQHILQLQQHQLQIQHQLQHYIQQQQISGQEYGASTRHPQMTASPSSLQNFINQANPLQLHFQRYLQQCPQSNLSYHTDHRNADSNQVWQPDKSQPPKFPVGTGQAPSLIPQSQSQSRSPSLSESDQTPLENAAAFPQQLQFQPTRAFSEEVARSRDQSILPASLMANGDTSQRPEQKHNQSNLRVAAIRLKRPHTSHDRDNVGPGSASSSDGQDKWNSYAQSISQARTPPAPTDVKKRGRPRKYILDPSTNEYIDLSHSNFKALNKLLKSSSCGASIQLQTALGPIPHVIDSQALSILYRQPVRNRNLDDEGVKQLLQKKDKRGRPRKFPIEQTGTTIQGIRINGTSKPAAKKQKTKWELGKESC